MKTNRNLIVVVTLLMGILVYLVGMRLGSNSGNNGVSTNPPPLNIKARDLVEIGKALRNYETNEGQLPKKLSDLVPKYISASILIPGRDSIRKDRENAGNNDVLTPLQSDNSSAFEYLGERGRSIGVVAYEAINYQSDLDYPFRRKYLSGDLQLSWCSEREFQKRIQSLFQSTSPEKIK